MTPSHPTRALVEALCADACACVGAVTRRPEGFVRDQCARPEGRVVFLAEGQDDRSRLDAMGALVGPLADALPLARAALGRLVAPRAKCDGRGRLRVGDRAVLRGLGASIESALA